MTAQIITFTPAQPASRRAHLDATQAPDKAHPGLNLIGQVYVLGALGMFVAMLINVMGG